MIGIETWDASIGQFDLDGGVLLLGVSDNSVSKNLVENNGYVGIGVLGWCTAVSTGPPNRNCIFDPPQANPQANDNRIAQNTLIDNGDGAQTLSLIARQEIEYLAPVPYLRKPIDVQLWIGRLGGSSLEVCYEVCSPVGAGQRACAMRST